MGMLHSTKSPWAQGKPAKGQPPEKTKREPQPQRLDLQQLASALAAEWCSRGDDLPLSSEGLI
jgi:hypothetical protein